MAYLFLVRPRQQCFFLILHVAQLIGVPPLLIGSTLLAFHVFVRAFGLPSGYLAGFLLYWLLWCGAVPVMLLGRDGIVGLWRQVPFPVGKPAWIGVVAIALPLLLGYGYAFPRALATATPSAVFVSAVLAAVNAPLEELLWRGCYREVFGQSTWLGYVYPNVAFGMWHVAPLSVIPNRAPGGTLSFVAVSCVVGLLWGWIVQRTGSVRVTSVTHMLFDFSGLGGRIYFA